MQPIEPAVDVVDFSVPTVTLDRRRNEEGQVEFVHRELIHFWV